MISQPLDTRWLKVWFDTTVKRFGNYAAPTTYRASYYRACHYLYNPTLERGTCQEVVKEMNKCQGLDVLNG